jgi:hypothetical protein
VYEVNEQLNKRPRQERKAHPVEAAEAAVEPFASVTPIRGGDPDPILTLSKATLSFGGRGDGIELPVVRVPARAVTSWWVSGGKYIKPSSSGGGLIGGVVFPIGN